MSLTENWARKLVLNRLTAWERGRLRVRDLTDGATIHEFGKGEDEPIEIEVRQGSFYRRLLSGGSLGVAESYLDGEWECSDLTGLFRLVLQNQQFSNSLGKKWGYLGLFAGRLAHWLKRNTKIGSRRNIQAHYDLGNELFALMLDETWAYSSAIFRAPEATLRTGSIEKFDRACRKLNLKRGEHLLEIGTGWGGLAIHAAREYGCEVTTTTISEEQYRLAKERIENAGLRDRIHLRKQDYRDLQGKYDKLVSIEMIEAVGDRFLGKYLQTCSRLLKPEGTMVLQGILMNEQDHQAYVGSVDFIQKYVFPGGCLPSIRSIGNALADRTDLRWVHFEDFAPHYARTLRLWRGNFERERDAILKLGYDERFLRTWMYYLCYCEAAFDVRYLGLGQLQFDKPGCRRDPMLLSQWASCATRGLVSFADSGREICARTSAVGGNASKRESA